MFAARSKFLSSLTSPLVVSIRLKHNWNPGTLEQRIFRAVTQPILPERIITTTDRYMLSLEEKKRRENNPYRKFLTARARSDLLDAAENRMLLIFDCGYHKFRELIPIKNQVFKLGVNVKIFPNPILKAAAKDTRWEPLSDFLLNGNESNLYMLGDPDPNVCSKVIKITKRSNFLNLLGSVVGHRILTQQETIQFSQQQSLSSVQSQLVGSLEVVPRQTLSLLTHHQRELTICLEQLASRSTSQNDTSSSSSSDDD